MFENEYPTASFSKIRERFLDNEAPPDNMESGLTSADNGFPECRHCRGDHA
jgi:hypothetical protein